MEGQKQKSQISRPPKTVDIFFQKTWCEHILITIFGQNMPKQLMSKKNNTSFGEYIRQLREERDLPLRKIAAELDIDTSTLSKIEKNERSANEQLLEKLAEVFHLNIADLKVRYLSDKITYQLLDEENGIEILKVAEQKIKYHKQQSKK